MDFCIRIKLKFTHEIDSGRDIPTFRVYILPERLDDIENNWRLVDDDVSFRQLRETLLDPSASHPLIYVWNYDNVSLAKLPPVAQQEEIDTKSETGSELTRSTHESSGCKFKDGNTCLCCGYVGRDGFGLHACHIYELREHKMVKDEERDAKLVALNLMSVHDQGNLITLCEKCHRLFDSNKLGIHPTEHTWIVTTELRDRKANSGKPFIDIHAKKVPFARRFVPPTEVLEGRISHFRTKNSEIHYCHTCQCVTKDKADLDDHVRGCSEALTNLVNAVGLK